MKRIGAFSLFLVVAAFADAPCASFHPGELWPDDKGVHINAHGGGLLVAKGHRVDFSRRERYLPIINQALSPERPASHLPPTKSDFLSDSDEHYRRKVLKL